MPLCIYFPFQSHISNFLSDHAIKPKAIRAQNHCSCTEELTMLAKFFFGKHEVPTSLDMSNMKVLGVVDSPYS